MKLIPLTQGKFAKVDDEDFEWLSQFKWQYDKSTRHNYAVRHPVIDGKKTYIAMHRLIMQTPSGFETDHINGDGLDNQRINLRICTKSENRHNCKKYRNNTTGYRGVCYKKDKGWYAQLALNGKRITFCYYQSAEDAAKIFDAKSLEIFGNVARLNFPLSN